jgi:hypothetical protein
MSLSRLAIRLCAVHLLQEAATIAQDRVFDSRNDPIDFIAGETRKPFVTVVTDTDTLQVQGMDLTKGERSLELIFEMGVAVPVPVPDSPDTVTEVPDTDGGLEILLDILGYQTEQAVQGSPTEWAELFREFVTGMQPSRVSRRASDTAKGVRWAARQVVYSCDTIAEPLSGEPLLTGSPWLRLVAQLEASDVPELVDLAGLLSHLWAVPSRSSWELVQAALGLTLAGVQSAGVTPAFDDAEAGEEAPPLAEVQVGEDGPVFDQDDVDQQLP